MPKTVRSQPDHRNGGTPGVLVKDARLLDAGGNVLALDKTAVKIAMRELVGASDGWGKSTPGWIERSFAVSFAAEVLERAARFDERDQRELAALRHAIAKRVVARDRAEARQAVAEAIENAQIARRKGARAPYSLDRIAELLIATLGNHDAKFKLLDPAFVARELASAHSAKGQPGHGGDGPAIVVARLSCSVGAFGDVPKPEPGRSQFAKVSEKFRLASKPAGIKTQK